MDGYCALVTNRRGNAIAVPMPSANGSAMPASPIQIAFDRWFLIWMMGSSVPATNRNRMKAKVLKPEKKEFVSFAMFVKSEQNLPNNVGPRSKPVRISPTTAGWPCLLNNSPRR